MLARIDGIDRALVDGQASPRQGVRPVTHRRGARPSAPGGGPGRGGRPVGHGAGGRAAVRPLDDVPCTSRCSCSLTSPTSSRRGSAGTRVRSRRWSARRADRQASRPRSSTTSVASPCRTRCGTSRARCTRDERDRAEVHTLVTDQLLRRVPYTAALADIASACPRTPRRDGLPPAASTARHLAERAARDRRGRLLSGDGVGPTAPAALLSRDAAATELGRMSASRPPRRRGGRARARGGGPPPGGAARSPCRPHRSEEAEVLRLMALGLTTREMGEVDAGP